MSRSARHLACLTLLVAGLGAPVAAHAHDDDRVERRGSCRGDGDWRIRVEPDDGRLEVDVEIDHVRGGQRWSWVLTHNGTLSARGTSRGRGGSYEVKRQTVDAAGVDTFRFRARRGGSVCVATVTY
ncbi:hypothetical protein [Nocardioides currus]|uniref:Proteinase inhibitor I42 chagasin domain-containing protein n=1 Tax=Nocardioides currus TaxID=2133958 RepID=A0A2R7YRD7_9ACTN|nr:hypothetical protein [Nocardioides currus]PUA78978.1 hypothetical protein C7S10_21085 [Nocardioides currus]